MSRMTNSQSRRPTRTVGVGDVKIGSDYPIRVQSMTTADTRNTAGVIDEIERLVLAGCEIVRVTVPTKADADNLPTIRAEMKKRRLAVPIVADIHFTPSVAMMVVEHVEKVRINPGNFVDKKRFKVMEYTDAQYREELEKIYEKFAPLVKKCKAYGRAMRIGTNHGSLSDRIVNRYGDTTLGMVESALEFARICEDLDFRDFVFSMKSSNPIVMIEAYRALAKRLDELGMPYPFHLGVTEAGDGEDGRIKSAIGIGSLLEDGIGDTVRVSLTEDPEHEVPVAYDLVEKFNTLFLERVARGSSERERATVRQSALSPAAPEPGASRTFTGQDPFQSYADPHPYTRRKTDLVRIGELTIGGQEPIRVTTALPLVPGKNGLKTLERAERLLTTEKEAPTVEWLTVDIRTRADLDLLRLVQQELHPAILWKLDVSGSLALALGALPHAQALSTPMIEDCATLLGRAQETHTTLFWNLDNTPLHSILTAAQTTGIAPGIFTLGASAGVAEYRALARELERSQCRAPIHLRVNADHGYPNPILGYSVILGSLLCDGIGDSIELVDAQADSKQLVQLSYNILQASGLRISKADFVSCPSCGRTQFDLQTTTERIKNKFGHLKGVKIAVMGCIVNGPGEMADAHFGYVGAGPNKIDLYVGKECVTRGIDAALADQTLQDLISSHGRWVEPV